MPGVAIPGMDCSKPEWFAALVGQEDEPIDQIQEPSGFLVHIRMLGLSVEGARKQRWQDLSGGGGDGPNTYATRSGAAEEVRHMLKF